MKYPIQALNRGIKGTIPVSFVIDKKGKPTDFSLLETVHPLIDKEAMRVISEMPNWSPGLQDGEPVRVQYIFPIKFLIQYIKNYLK